MGQTKPQSYSVEELAKLVNDKTRTFDVLLYKTSRWIDWESNALLTGDARIIEVKPADDWPLIISFTGRRQDSQPAPYDKKMEFYCKTK